MSGVLFVLIRMFILTKVSEAEEMTQQLGALAALAEDPGSVLVIPMTSTIFWNSSLRVPVHSSDLHGLCMPTMHVDTCRQNIHTCSKGQTNSI